MALNKGGQGIYLSIADGQLTRQHKEPTSETKSRTNKNGKLVHEEFFRDITGMLVGLSKKENEYGVNYQLKMQDGEEVYIIQMPYSSRYSASFLKALPNIDKALPVKLMPWSIVDKNDSNKKVTGITMWQDDGNGLTKILPAFTKEDPNGLPEMVSHKVKEKGKSVTKWDGSAMEEFLEQVGVDFFKTPVTSDNEQEEPPF